MQTNVLFAGVATADLDTSIAWYQALLGRPPEIVVNDDEVMWHISEGGWLYLVRDPSRAGHALVTVSVPDLDQAVTEMVSRGLGQPRIETVGDAGRKAPVVDPEGNTVNLIEVLAQND